jgi:hypothetical protein
VHKGDSDNNNNNNNNIAFKQEGVQQMEDEMGLIYSTKMKINMYEKTQQKSPN